MSSYEESVKKLDEKKQSKENQTNQLSSFSPYDKVSNKIDQIIEKEPISPTSKPPDNEKVQKKEDESFFIEPRDQLEKKPIEPDFKTDVSMDTTINEIDEKEELFEISTPKKPKKSLSLPIHISKPKKVDHDPQKPSGKTTNQETVTNFFQNTDSTSENNTNSKKKFFELPFNLFSKKEKSGNENNTYAGLNSDQIPVEQHEVNEKKKTGFGFFKKEVLKKEKVETNNEPGFVEPSSNQNGSTPVQQTEYDQASSTNQTMDEEVLKLLAITDELLGKLPEDVISEFAASDDFMLYEKVMKKYHILKDES